MQMLDRILAIGSLAGVILFCYILMKFVAEPDLWVVIIMVLTIASYFIIRELRQGGSHFARKENGQNVGDRGA
ncbi:MAG: hypothetical protein COW30_18780 [Rhodospirillales bacterium CG15_BIG_FIL_POST_REV_8_21_14_020_66_15]|nr:MAG: hypothetical protein COW30_18780 [Rhodospirillales bacterium CG15_BIG_FIL_POST_REV_8_21_14_020_66_15]